MTGSAAHDELDLSTEQVRLLLAQQGFEIPEVELLEVTASVNALIEGLANLEGYGTLQDEPWPTLVGYVHGAASVAPRRASVPGTEARIGPDDDHA